VVVLVVGLVIGLLVAVVLAIVVDDGGEPGDFETVAPTARRAASGPDRR
jgi:hypothetical protein